MLGSVPVQPGPEHWQASTALQADRDSRLSLGQSDGTLLPAGGEQRHRRSIRQIDLAQNSFIVAMDRNWPKMMPALLVEIDPLCDLQFL